MSLMPALSLRFTTICRLLVVAAAMSGCAQKEVRGPVQPPVDKVRPVPVPSPAPKPPSGKLGVVVNGNVWSLALDDLKPRLEQAATSGITVKRTDNNQIVAVIPSDLGFTPHSVTLGGAPKPFLDSLANGVWSNNDIQITLIGHTDNADSDPQAITLSLGRARAMRDYLLSKGVTTPFLQAIGRGGREPSVSNDSAAGRTKNRRIEIWIREAAR